MDLQQEEKLWKKYKKTKDPKIREIFVKKYAPLVKYVAGKVAINMPSNVDFDDLVGYGVFGLLDAIEKYDPEKEIKFKTYAITRIRGAIYDELRSIDWIPRSVRQKAKEIEKVIARLELKLNRPATDEEVAAELGISVDEFQSLLHKVGGATVISLNDSRYSNSGDDSFSVSDMIEGPAGLNPDTIVEREEIKRIVAKAIAELPDKEKKVLILYYYEDLTLKEIGEVLGVTESRISQLHTKAIMRLKAKLSNIKESLI